MTLAETTLELDGQTVTIRAGNLRVGDGGMGLVNVSAKMAKGSASAPIIATPSISISTDVGSASFDARSLSADRFITETVPVPPHASTIDITYQSNYGLSEPETTFSVSGLDASPPTACSFTNTAGEVGDPQIDAAEAAFAYGILTPEDIGNYAAAYREGTPISGCVGSGDGPSIPTPPDDGRDGVPDSDGGLSPVVIGLGVLGAGAVAVALSQRD